MNAKVRALTRSAVSAALAVVLLWLGAALPSGRLALTAAAGLAALFVMLECGGRWAFGVYLISALLGFLLTPVKAGTVLYVALLGYYPALKCLIERIRSAVLQWACKLVLFNAALSAVYLLAHAVFSDTVSAISTSMPLWALCIGLNAVFLVYDIGLKGLIRIYIRRFAGKRNGVG